MKSKFKHIIIINRQLQVFYTNSGLGSRNLVYYHRNRIFEGLEVETMYFEDTVKFDEFTARLKANNFTQIESKKDLDEFLFAPPVSFQLLESIIDKLKFDLSKALREGKIQDKELQKLMDTKQLINFLKKK